MTTGNISWDSVELVIFGDFGVLTNTPFRDGGPLAMLPGRVERLTQLREERAREGGPDLRYGVMGNKGGVAFGIQTEEEAIEEVRWTAEQIGAAAYAVCFAHQSPAAGFGRYAAPELLAYRKPQPGMIEQIRIQLDIAKEHVLVVGNYADDCRAAKAAGVAWQLANVFFATAGADARASGAPKQETPAPLDDFDPFLDEGE